MNPIKRFLAIIAILSISTVLASCGDSTEDSVKHIKNSYDIVCIDGVKYIIASRFSGYKGYGYMSVKYNADGTVATCESYR